MKRVFQNFLQVHPMIKTLGPLEDAPDLDSIAPVLRNWADLIRHKDNAVSKALFFTLLYADTHCFLTTSPDVHACMISILAQVHLSSDFALLLHYTRICCRVKLMYLCCMHA